MGVYCGVGVSSYHLDSKNVYWKNYECYPGMCRMKALARFFLWWPEIDLDIEERVRPCDGCTQVHHSPKAVPLLLWPWSTEPWQRIHVDYAEVKG